MRKNYNSYENFMAIFHVEEEEEVRKDGVSTTTSFIHII